MDHLFCLRCDTKMQFLKREKMQLGQTGWILGDLPNLVAGSMEVDIYVCPNCRKLEFFVPESHCEEDILQKKCPKCGKTHDFDFPKCPFCKYDYYR